MGLLGSSIVGWMRTRTSRSTQACRSSRKVDGVEPGRPSIRSTESGRRLRRNSMANSSYFSTLMFLRLITASVPASKLCIDILPSATIPAWVKMSMILDRCLTVFLA